MRRFEDSDLAEVNAWCAARGLTPWRREDLPPVGFIEPGVAVAWLYCTDGSIAMVHNLVTNPASEAGARVRAGWRVFDACLGEAKALGFRHFLGWSSDGRMLGAAKRRGLGVGETVTLVTGGL